MMDAVIKEPKRLQALVAEHNQRISSANESQLGVVRALEARKQAATEERDRLVKAIALGTGAAEVLVAELEKRVQELQELERSIAEAESRVQPLLLPRPLAVQDYVSGTASVFEGDFGRDRKFLETVIDGILVYANGAIVLQFQEASLFEPVRSYRLTRDGGEAPPLPLSRALHANGMEMVQELVGRYRPDESPQEVDFMVRQDKTGAPCFVATKNARSVEGPGVVNNAGVPNGIRNVTDRPGGRRSAAGRHGPALGRVMPEQLRCEDPGNGRPDRECRVIRPPRTGDYRCPLAGAMR